ncbi:MAG: phosphatidylserine decarboxylase [Okeania sp. SIO2G4]|uniref:archaetidylserine decarboxylase n=1 Tax=unclassified Okeania TaxID=2634635 RepID=UPI0013B96538|nr:MULTISPECIES: archaetidylserine decarboxylase [unclassified Okeania]NEP06170.1 phosphatidylserine decarboxylase [Okeania sp. SIO4D6]NEP38755.1 phosphatidylserine decarboxylase [Okeania sp. SIO2H7]NEP74794.1 phosphatidylserine decarboxylase [Okeania sp. SIO2G5]NEP95869.1 phosphatidylserine decarboxylase [Okeania sp. SIO2F5]NEQ93596.1 phosphatidylserine decarboxylase [Okeania sp. SIO2G4]
MIFDNKEKTEICYRNRQTGEINTEKVFSEKTLRWLYENPLGFTINNYLLNNYLFCYLYGKLQDLPSSRKKINKLINQYQINLEEIELSIDKYKNFNAFFSRKLKPNARHFIKDKNIFCSPGDGKILVYPQLEEKVKIPVKGSFITLESLLNCKATARKYINGSAIILRLAPADYHRFHFPDDGEASRAKTIKGQYHSVNPIALNKVPNLFCLNKRSVTELKSSNFGKIAYIEIGAITIGSIIQTYIPGMITKGQEKGYFQYGGSTIVLLFESKKISFDEDLIQDSSKNLEVQVLAGTQIGIKEEND